MNPLRKGTDAERKLVNLLKSRGFNAYRVAGSKGMKSVDVIAMYDGKLFIFQVKCTKYDKIRVSRREIKNLVDLYNRHKAFVYLAVKFGREWRFYHVAYLWSLLSGVFETFEIIPKNGVKLDDMIRNIN